EPRARRGDDPRDAGLASRCRLREARHHLDLGRERRVAARRRARGSAPHAPAASVPEVAAVNPVAAFAPADLVALVDEARRAPSVHNIQPARWAALERGVLALRADPARTLPIADPSGHDVRISLGAACEGMSIALSRRGF